MTTVNDKDTPMSATFNRGDRIRHRRRWYGVVVDDQAGAKVLVRFDDGTPPTSVFRDDLQRASDIDAEVQRLIDQLGALRRNPQLGSDEVSMLNQSMEALRYSLSERALGVRVAAEIDLVATAVLHEPFSEEIVTSPRVRKWFTEGAQWALQKLQDHAGQLRVDRTESRI